MKLPLEQKGSSNKQTLTLRNQPFFTPVIQTKLIVGEPGDKYEKEADWIANQVNNTNNPLHFGENLKNPPFFNSSPTIQKHTKESAIPSLKQNDLINANQDVHEQIHTSSVLPGETAGTSVSSIVQEVLHSSGRPLDPTIRAYMEPRFGCDFSQVKIHSDSLASEAAHSVKAKAFTVGQNMVFGKDHYAPNTDTGRWLLSHELTHVVQQSARTGNALQRATVSDVAEELAVNQQPANKAAANTTTLHYTETPPYCCISGAQIGYNALVANKKITPQAGVGPAQAAFNLFQTKQAKDIVEVDVYCNDWIKGTKTLGPFNFVKGKLSLSVLDPLQDLLGAASADNQNLNCDDTKSGGITRTYRNLVGQWKAFHKNNHHTNLAAAPGSSNHGTGKAIDFQNGISWLTTNAGKYGWLNYYAENWHYDHVSTPNIISTYRNAISGNKVPGRLHSGEKIPKPITPNEKKALRSQYTDAEVYVALKWNREQNYSSLDWKLVQNCVDVGKLVPNSFFWYTTLEKLTSKKSGNQSISVLNNLTLSNRPAFAGYHWEGTGVVDEDTVKGVIAWQLRNGLSNDGKVDQKTLNAMGIKL